MLKVKKKKLPFNVVFEFWKDDKLVHKTGEFHPDGIKYFNFEGKEYVNIGSNNDIYVQV